MLVLSRRTSEKILLPSINASIQVVAIKGGAVRLGIDAPPGVPVLREELLKKDGLFLETTPTSQEQSQLRELRHMVRNRLNVTTIGLALLRQQVRAGMTDALEQTIVKLEEEMRMLRQRLESEVPTPAPASAPLKPTRARKALLVEDDQNERELLAGYLRLSGFAVDTANDGCDALDYLQTKEQPDVVLLDMGLPRCDGPTTAREIRRNQSCAGLRIFAVSGHSPEEYDLDCGPSGIDRWFHKPIDPALLLRELTEELGN